MRPILNALSHRFTGEHFDSRVGQLACSLAGVAILPLAVLALIRNPGNRAEFLLGLGLSGLVTLLCVMLGMLCRHAVGLANKVALRSRWPEFASYLVCFAVLMTGIMSLTGLGLTPIQITLGLLMTGSLSLGILVLGMMTTLVGARKR
jgi:hypothetical protein